MREVDDAHDPVDQAQPARDQEEHRRVEERVEDVDRRGCPWAPIRCPSSWRGINPELRGRHLRVDEVVAQGQRHQGRVGARLEPALEIHDQAMGLHLAGHPGGGHRAVGAQDHVAAGGQIGALLLARGSPAARGRGGTPGGTSPAARSPARSRGGRRAR